MAYCGVEDVRKILGGVRGNEGANTNANDLDDDQIEFAISDADEQINAVLRNKYLIPIKVLGVTPAEPPAIVHNLSINVACYLAVLEYRQDREFASPLAAIIMRYQRALDMLRKIEHGDIVLNIDTVGSADPSNMQTVFNQYDGPMFPSSNIFNAPEGLIPPDRMFR